MEAPLQTALHHQMSTLQDIIKRMAENSRNVKTWCISLVSALLIFSSKTETLSWCVLFLPILPLMYLDMYYLALERFYRNEYDKIKQKFKVGDINLFNVYNMESPKNKLKVLSNFKSNSILPFYGILLFLSIVIGCHMNKENNWLDGLFQFSFNFTFKSYYPHFQ